MTASRAPSSSVPPPPISRVGRFYITRELGSGTAGTVYLGHDPVIDRPVAIKTFNSARLTPIERRQYEQQFINEARAAGRLSHPHIVTIFDASSEGGTTYIAMEYLQGRELNRLLDSGHRFSTNDIASIVSKIADALHYAHSAGVIHRDIKPANIFLLGERNPKVVDFGIARAPNRVSDHPTETDPYTMFHQNLLGTPNYMSPEQAMGRDVDHRTDIYSLGAVTYEMLTGKRPFRNTKTESLLEEIAYKAPPAPHEIDAAVPAELSQIVMKAMSKRPEKRYQDAQEFAHDLKRYLAHARNRAKKLKSPAAVAAPALKILKRDPTLLYWLTGVLGGAIALALYAWLR
jgi:eukaryotic-like serine/threonine-protein kinase